MKPPLIDLLYQALNADFGVVVSTSNPERLRQKLYAERKKDEALSIISINISPTSPETELWLIKK